MSEKTFPFQRKGSLRSLFLWNNISITLVIQFEKKYCKFL